jgi:hypothetical protein
MKNMPYVFPKEKDKSKVFFMICIKKKKKIVWFFCFFYYMFFIKKIMSINVCTYNFDKQLVGLL